VIQNDQREFSHTEALGREDPAVASYNIPVLVCQDRIDHPILMNRGSNLCELFVGVSERVSGVEYQPIDRPNLDSVHHFLGHNIDLFLVRGPPCTRGFEDEVRWIYPIGDELYVLTFKGAPRSRIVVTSAKEPDLATAKEILPQSRGVIQRMAHARDGLYVTLLDGGLSRVVRIDLKTKAVSEIRLPYEGTIFDWSAGTPSSASLNRKIPVMIALPLSSSPMPRAWS